jgi:hypothetical protein
MRCWLSLAVVFSLVSVAAAQRPRPSAITDPAQAGPDYALQGEYLGSVYFPGRGSEGCGLQVVALGGGKFDAVCYRGGLPGAGWDRVTKLNYSGQAEDGKVTFALPSGGFTVDGLAALSFDSGGRPLGQLAKINRTSPTMGQPPPAGATVLFDGRPSELLPNAKITEDGLLLAGVLTKIPVDAFRLHLEFRTPFMPAARGQARGNSGVYIQQRYEVQILDSFGLEGVENECGGLYRQTRPDVNMCLPPLAWQTYDIWFSPPQFDADGTTKLANARLTVLHNGVPIHWHREISAKTGGGRPEAPQALPINLQDHGNPVAFRNIWIVPGQGDNELLAASYVRLAPTYQSRHRCRLFRRR